ncbi:MAG: TRAP transporter permease [Burkholderiales bacterium]|nr:TRAP transporter permease [Burkholderiales bacterium]MBZ0251081.1 TRAP transporter permease [Burkholderiales bacterium]
MGRAIRWAAGGIAIAMSLYHMWFSASPPPEAMIFRGTHLLFALVLVFLLYPAGGRDGPRRLLWLDLGLVALSAVAIGYIFANYQYIVNRIIYIDDLTAWDKAMAVVTVVLVLDATRRVIGWALPLTALAFLAYAVFGSGIKMQVLLEQMYLSTDGIFGSTLGVSASYVIVFVLFGAFMERSGTGRLFMDFALSLTGHTAGGPGKVSIVSSSLFGTISGSAVANVMVDGPITIPLMKKTGFRPPFAAAVEASASTGGQIMPPIMGAAAFVMAEYLAVSYFQVTVWAWIPALLFYVALFFAVHFEAKRVGLKGVPRAELPRLGQVMRERGHLFIPILLVLAGMGMSYSAPLCALVGTIATLPIAFLRASTRAGITWRTVVEALEGGARDALAVAMACACAGIVIGVISLTGLGITFTQVVIALAQNSLILALVLTAIAGIVLGMGMPTTPAYIVMVSLLVPALIKLGVVTPAAHMFALYFAVLSAITPPVALAVFAAAALAKANMWRAGFESVRIAAAGFIVPFMFVFEPALLAIGEWQTIALAAATATVGVMCLAAALYGYLLAPLALWQRLALAAGAILLIKPGIVTDSVGLALLLLVGAMQWVAARRSVPGGA